MKASNRATGRRAEEVAAQFLQGKGFRVILRNFSTRFGEIDLICRDKDTLVFVEVKSKTGPFFGLPEEMFTPQKLAQVKRLAQVYLARLRRAVACRIDVVAVVWGEGATPVRISHYPNVTGH